MSADLYERLARHLDDLPAGFPRTESGVELRLLRRLFTPEQAEVALHLTLIPEEARVVARRARLPVEEAARRLEEMERKRIIAGEHDGPAPRYQAMQCVIGFWEGQVDRLDPELIRDFEEYLPSLFDAESWRKAPQLRTIPIGVSISPRIEAMPYERAEAIVGTHDTFAVANCICRQELHVMGEGCDRPLETCLAFGKIADHVVRAGRGRFITRDEVLQILRKADETGLVLQPSNAKDALFMCACCGCCCGVLRSVKRYPRPASLMSSAFIAALDAETCEGCGTCESRCQMAAIHVDDGRAVLELDRCIGCGLCVTTCPSESLSLARKPAAEQPQVPKDLIDNYIRLAQARDRLGTRELIGMQVRSKWDRLAAFRVSSSKFRA